MSDNRKRFFNTHSGRELLKKHSLTEYGVWRVRGEDPNCDYGGFHHMPEIGTFEGVLDDIINFAVDLSGFWDWGAGGDITKVDMPIKIDASTNKRRKEIEKRINELEEELKQAKETLRGI